MTDTEPKPVSSALPDFMARLAAFAPRSTDEIKSHLSKTEIMPAIARWGFDTRFQREISMEAKQGRVFRNICERMSGKGAIVALIGERGLGKTTLAAQFAIRTAWRNESEKVKECGPHKIESVIYRKCAKIVARYKPLFGDFGSIETESLMESLDYLCRQQEYLVIDEVHDCEEMKMRNRVLTDLIDRRYSCCRDTILIANQTSENFAATIGDSILSRLNEHGLIIECKWPSFRSPKP